MLRRRWCVRFGAGVTLGSRCPLRYQKPLFSRSAAFLTLFPYEVREYFDSAFGGRTFASCG